MQLSPWMRRALALPASRLVVFGARRLSFRGLGRVGAEGQGDASVPVDRDVIQ